MVKINFVSSNIYQQMILQKGTKFCSSDSSDFYRVGINQVLKDYQYERMSIPGNFLLQILENWKVILTEQSKITDFDELLKMEELWLVDGFLKGITMPVIPPEMIDFEDYIKSFGTKMPLICESFSCLNSLFEKGSQLGLVFLDSTTKGNLKINPHTSRILFCDVEGIQTKKIFPFTATDFLNLNDNEFIMKKYLRCGIRGMYANPNTNRLILLTYFIKLCTRCVWITENYPGIPKKIAIELILQEIGLSKDEILSPIIQSIYSKKDIPRIEDDRWKEFGQAYTLVPTNYGAENAQGYAFKRR